MTNINYTMIFLIRLIFFVSIIFTNSCTHRIQFLGNWKNNQKEMIQLQEMNLHRNGKADIKNNEEWNVISWDYSNKKRVLVLSDNDQTINELIVTYIDPVFLNSIEGTNSILFTRDLSIPSNKYTLSKKSIIGNWTLQKFNEKDSLISNLMELSFFENGYCNRQNSNNNFQEQWLIDTEAEHLILFNSKEKSTFTINFIKKDLIRLEDSFGTYYLKKTDKNSKAKRQFSKLMGNWKLIEINNLKETFASNMFINLDGTVKIFQNNHIQQSGQWVLSNDHRSLLMQFEEENILYEIESINSSKLKLKSGISLYTFKKSQYEY